MDTKQVGEKLVSLCRDLRNKEAVDTLYSRNIVSVEPHGTPEMPAQMRGIDKIRGKNQWWFENNEVHSAQVEGPFPHKDRFTVKFHWEVTPKSGPMKGKRMQIDEVGLYTVKRGKIVREEFFYSM